LNEQLHASTVETVITKEERAAMEAEARKQSEKAAALEKQLAQLQKIQSTDAIRPQGPANAIADERGLQSFRVAQMSQLQEEVDAQRRENARLADGVKVLAAKSSELAREIHDNRPLTPNMIFEEMSTNRVLASFSGVKIGLVWEGFLQRQAGADHSGHRRNQHFALPCAGHSADAVESRHAMGGIERHAGARLRVLSHPVALLLHDGPAGGVDSRAGGGSRAPWAARSTTFPRIPYVFQDAVVVGTREDYYGECKFPD
jgi:hypothetical protein